MDGVEQKFLKYIKYDTRSLEDVDDFPSTKKQLVLLNKLAEELVELGLKKVEIDKYGYVYASIDSNIEKNVPKIGFIAHVDTSFEMPGDNIKPNIILNYNGEDIVLNKENNIILSVSQYKELKNYKGQTIITTDGTTLLGADDKAGIAEIMSAVEFLVNNPEIKHGDIKIAFTPDEEVGRGVDFFDIERFGADFAYTIDGGKIGEIEYENFNAAKVLVTTNGINTHPGTAKNKMKNAVTIASEFIASLPKNETPEMTDGYEGFYHVNDIKGDVVKTIIKLIIRDFDINNLNNRKEFIKKICSHLNLAYGENTITCEIKDQYFNMIDKIKENKYIVDIACQAIEMAGIKPSINPIRGGTDGSRLSFMGLPCPNIFTGGHNFHGKYEYIPVESMKKSVEVILNIIKLIAE